MWLLRPESYWFVLVTSYTPYALPGYLVAGAALAVLRPAVRAELRRWVTGGLLLALAGVGLHAALLAPSYVGEHSDGPVDLTLLTANMRKGGGDADGLVRLVRDDGVQVLVLSEVTPRLEAALGRAGLPELLPHTAGAAGTGSSGTVVWSAFPLAEESELPLEHRSLQVRVQAPEPFWLVAVHAAQPIKNAGNDWGADWSVLDRLVPRLEGPVVLAGDLNTTLDHAPLRRLLADGFADAARASNAGWQPTYPNGFGLIAIDHVLTRDGYDAVSTARRSLSGTDHWALLARLAAR